MRFILGLVGSLALAGVIFLLSLPLILAALITAAGVGLYFYWRVKRLMDKAEHSFEKIVREEEGEIIDVKYREEPPERLQLPK
ncbi:hypothetical protein [Thermosulfuriphilus sp.]